MTLLTVGVLGTSRKKSEKRVPIHPGQLDRIESEVRNHLVFEEGYGRPFGVEDERLVARGGGLLPRDELFRECDVIVLPKPTLDDFDSMKEGGILWGWAHCVQQESLTQSAIDRRLTLITWEAMHQWNPGGEWQAHTFYENNELAGYAGVLDALRLTGSDGRYGPPRDTIVIAFGSVSRGAVYALQGMGFERIRVFTNRRSPAVLDPIVGVEYRHFEEDASGELMAVDSGGSSRPFIEELASADIIVNGVLQDTDHPLMFVGAGQTGRLKQGSLIVDISCDEGMGFPFARPTTFDDPMFEVDGVHYYAVDHTPSYLWNSASWAISDSLLPYLSIVMRGPEAWESDQTIRRAIEIRDGRILNPKILSFQGRAPEYPHPCSPAGRTAESPAGAENSTE